MAGTVGAILGQLGAGHAVKVKVEAEVSKIVMPSTAPSVKTTAQSRKSQAPALKPWRSPSLPILHCSVRRCTVTRFRFGNACQR